MMMYRFNDKNVLIDLDAVHAFSFSDENESEKKDFHITYFIGATKFKENFDSRKNLGAKLEWLNYYYDKKAMRKIK